MKSLIIGLCLFFLFPQSDSLLAEDGFTQKDRELLIELRVKIGEIDKRFEQIDKKISELREDMNIRFEEMMTFMWMLVVIFVGVTGMAISFALWDRRTMIRPFESKTREIEKKIKEIDEGKLENLILSLRELAKKDNKVAEALKKFNLL